jgi:hypothetical protein
LADGRCCATVVSLSDRDAVAEVSHGRSPESRLAGSDRHVPRRVGGRRGSHLGEGNSTDSPTATPTRDVPQATDLSPATPSATSSQTSSRLPPTTPAQTAAPQQSTSTAGLVGSWTGTSSQTDTDVSLPLDAVFMPDGRYYLLHNGAGHEAGRYEVSATQVRFRPTGQASYTLDLVATHDSSGQPHLVMANEFGGTDELDPGNVDACS